jgi:hypothetical protein
MGEKAGQAEGAFVNKWLELDFAAINKDDPHE